MNIVHVNYQTGRGYDVYLGTRWLLTTWDVEHVRAAIRVTASALAHV